MKKKKILIYILSGLIPLSIFFMCGILNNFLPFGKHVLNIYDSYSQYPGLLLEFKNALLRGNLMYSWNVGLGFNFFGTITYYTFSPLNLFYLLANQLNYNHIMASLTYLRIFLLGLSLCFYLDKRGTKSLYIILFSTFYALMGYTSAYYYNHMWVDVIIMFPLVIHGLDKLIDEEKQTFYIVSLTLSIIFNYYIGYMVCIFSLIYFIYKLILKENKKVLIKKFIISSLLVGLMSSVILLPSYFALKTGKSLLYSYNNYYGISKNAVTFFYSLTSGSFQEGDQIIGPAQVYSTIFVLVLTILFFFNKKISKKEKISTFLVLLLFYLSFSINIINYAWQFFQKPIWWPSRFSFIFSFFIILTALKSLENIQYIEISKLKRMLISIIFIILCIIGLLLKMYNMSIQPIYIYIYLSFSLLLFIEMIFFIDKKIFMPFIILLAIFDVSINTYNNLKQNKLNVLDINYYDLRNTLPNKINELNKKNNNDFFRFELDSEFTSNDGLYFNYHGINYFNSVRNIKPLNTLKKLGQKFIDNCHTMLSSLDPVFLSLFNIKYIYGDIEYFDDIGGGIKENPYPLALGFAASEKIKYLNLSDKNPKTNLNLIINTLLDEEIPLYKVILNKDFKLDNAYLDGKYIKLNDKKTPAILSYEFISDARYIMMPEDITKEIYINNIKIITTNHYVNIEKGDKVRFVYKIYNKILKDDIFLNLLDYNQYEIAMQKLSNNLMTSKTFVDNHILESNIKVNGDSYLFTTIEYEEGMKIYVDGKRIKPDILFDAFIGFDIKSGNHTITIDYIPKGLIPGLVISTISLIATIFYLQKSKKTL